MNIYFLQGFREFNYFDLLRNNVFDIKKKNNITIIDISNLLHKNKVFHNKEDLLKEYKILKFKNYFYFLYYILRVPKKSFFIIEGLSVEFSSLLLYVIIKFKKSFIIRQGFSLGFFEILQSQNLTVDFEKKDSNTNLLNQIKYKLRILNNKYKKLLKSFLMIKTDFYIYAGKLNKSSSKDNFNSKTFFISNYSYEFYECKKNNELKFDYTYAVFIDQAIGFHQETLGLDESQINLYYQRLNNFFEYIENKLKIKVIIAVHPLVHNVDFKGRTCIRDNTAGLIKNSDFVIGISSGAIIYPIILNKKLILIKSSIILKLLNIRNYIFAIEEIMQLKYHSIDNLSKFDLKNIQKVNFAKRKKIIKDFALDINNFSKDPFGIVKQISQN